MLRLSALTRQPGTAAGALNVRPLSHAGRRCGGRAAPLLPPPPAPRRHCQPRMPVKAGAGSDDISDILKKYSSAGGSEALQKAPTKQQREAQGQANGGMGNGLFAILLLNFAAFLGANVLHFRPLADLTLNHWAPQWWQFVTATFMHANWQHLSGNAFALLVFGRMVEEEEGALGLWLTYLLSGVGGTVASYLTAPHTHTISLGASGAVFGLFMVALIAKFKPSLKRLLEFTILGQFVVQQVLGEVQQVAAGKGAMIGGMQVGHIAHLAGAAVGVVLVLLVSRLPEVGDDGA